MDTAKRKKLYLIGGANGSGKTTFAHELLREESGIIFLNADETAAKIGDTLGIASGRAIITEANQLLALGESFVMESTISGKYHLRILKEAKEKGYEVILIYVFLDFPKLNITRIKNRVLLGGHNVPDIDVLRRARRSIKNFQETLQLADSWKLYYNGGDGHIQIAAGWNGCVEILIDKLYKKFQKELIDND